ncbi:hyaluronidase-2-like isoform X2 [Scleropages formosus]|uniref:hyaluronidase-2-like isoform X2 n=1 Tax=Scleropages formosus TaxID=113540 RepID=UPI0006359FD2|nr:hyaluronidase-2-like isoform X2 [Scleropages formosus]
MSPSRWAWLLLLLLWDGIRARVLKPTRRPLVSQKPVLLAWNAPTQDCGPRHKIWLKLDQFDIEASPSEGFVRQNLTMFYKERLGLYPFFEDSGGAAVNGGLPQAASLTEHLEKMPQGVNKYIREAGAKGLAVIDWEEWRPLWFRNWNAKDVYRERSRLLVAKKNPEWTAETVTKVAQQEFELSARKFMLETLRLAKSLRPNQLWGFYLFPDCYNHDYKSGLAGYTGRCPDVEMARNDQLSWLWTESTALFPSIYMASALRSTPSGRLFVRNRVQEGMRLASVGDGLARPVFVYTRPTYMNELSPLTEASCSSLDAFLRGPLSRYLLNVSTAAQLCSQVRCSSQGRCVRRHPDSDTYLHLSAQSHTVVDEGGQLRVRGNLGPAERQLFSTEFCCQCYSGYKDEACTQRETGAAPIMGPGWAWLLILLTLLH